MGGRVPALPEGRSDEAPGGIAQLVEHELCKLGVAGSNPVASTNIRGYAGDAQVWQSAGWANQGLP